ncbi:UFD1 domain-containing protein [Cephalotus follicularis]|uniref:UFD1 domain-containing protein n=1 Tax=Cephalotus follicularis TaxID=3775 RepID=A0A1Q3D467_CEPFO|nr:UFD1 domain-containing protein [Cephalotus follicularis]
MDHRESDNSFERFYRCFKKNEESGDKILMPPSALDSLVASYIQWPLLFELRNPINDRVSHCGVLEFIADEGTINLPRWMMENMNLEEGQIVIVKNVELEKGTYVKLQPHTKKFVELSNPKAILETQLRSFSCLTTGDTIMVMHNNKKYWIDIIETSPSSAISIIDTDCEVDFAPSLEYKEPERQEEAKIVKETEKQKPAIKKTININCQEKAEVVVEKNQVQAIRWCSKTPRRAADCNRKLFFNVLRRGAGYH